MRDWKGRWQIAGDKGLGVDIGLSLTSFAALDRGIEIIAGLTGGDPPGTALMMLGVARDVLEYRRNLLFRPVHYTVRNYMRNHHRMTGIVGRLFELDPNLIHRQLSIIGAQDSVWRHAMANLHRAA